ncbi:hypothetical protein WJX72_001580 [[Myrmecia] bisecta]|uniref:UspA domain-containing protein n=1 Tax=[Myrmecia] bisecta TaxID=41462 RepID=A0AAW1QQ79_9CHLO
MQSVAEENPALSPRLQRTVTSPRTSAERAQRRNRNLLVPVDDADDCELALKWMLENIYREGDTVYLLHVVPYAQAAYSGVFLAPSPHEQDTMVEQARAFMHERYIKILSAKQVPYHVIIQKGGGDADSIGQLICHKSDEVDSAVVAMASHTKGRIARYVVGSTTQFCVRHCRATVLVMHE